MKKGYNVVIVGSGAGGGVVAELLSRYVNQGLSVLLLEGGPYWPKHRFTQRELDMSRIFLRKGAVFTSDMQMSIAAASAVGGSTAVYTGVSFRPPESVIEEWRSRYGLGFLSDSFVSGTLDRIEQKINVHQLSPEEENDNNRLFREGCQKLNIPVKPLRINTRGCQGQGFCNLGCTAGAKQGTLEVQIPEARSRGVDLVYNAWVQQIGPRRVSFSVRPAPRGTEPNVEAEGNYEVEADCIVLAGGALNTPPLLLRSRKKLGIDPQNIGRFLTVHPAYNVNGVVSQQVKNYRGFPKLWYVDAFSESDGYYLETSFYYPGVTAKNQPISGVQLEELMKDYRKMMSILILVHDDAVPENRVGIDGRGETVVDYRLSDSARDSMLAALRNAARILFAAGCSRASIPASSKALLDPGDVASLGSLVSRDSFQPVRQPLSSAHPQGGARMGKDPSIAVTDVDGRLHGCDTVFVSDASLFPTSSHVNPYETVMLLATHVGAQVLRKFSIQATEAQ